MAVEEFLRAKLPAPAFGAARAVYNARPRALLARHAYQRDVAAGRAVAGAVGWTVQRGPFAGMRYVEAYGDLGAKVLGCYELELHGALEGLIAASYDNYVNIGAAEGYYAVGLAYRQPSAKVIAYEMDEAGRRLCSQMTRLNEVQVEVRGEFSHRDLDQLPAGNTLLIMDIEGGELPLLNPTIAPGLLQMDHLVELHDFIDDAIKPTILRRFSATHEIEIVGTAGRRPSDYPELTAATVRVLNEHRPGPMEWAVMRRRG